MSPVIARIFRRTSAVPLLCALTAGGFWLAGAPAPWLTGSALAATLAALAGAPPKVPPRLFELALLVLGLSLGAATGPGSLEAVWRWPASILALMISVPLTVGLAHWMLTRFFGWDGKDALLASVPGALSYTLAIAAAENLDVRRIAIVQSVRLLSIVLLVPLIFSEAAGVRTAPGAIAATSMGPPALALLAAAGVAASLLLKWINIPAAPMIGGLAVSCIAFSGGFATQPVPAWLTVPAIVIIGANVGSRFAGSRLETLAGMLWPSLACVAVTFATAAIAGALTATLLGMPMVQTLLAFAPGGLDTIAVLVLTLKLDAAFVTVHQLVRFLSIAAALPMLFRLMPRPAAQRV